MARDILRILVCLIWAAFIAALAVMAGLASDASGYQPYVKTVNVKDYGAVGDGSTKEPAYLI